MNLAWSHRVDHRGDERWPALAGAAALHALVIVAVIFLGAPRLKPGGTSVPINIVANAPTTDTRAAEQAPETHAAATENPVPETPPAPPPPAPSAPTAPKPAPTKTVAQPTPTPTRPATAQPQPAAKPSFDLDRLQASISKYAKPSPPKPAGGARGPAHAETALQARPAVANGVSASDVEGLGQLLNRLWNPNCAADPEDMTTTMSVDADGIPRDITTRDRNGVVIKVDPNQIVAGSSAREASVIRAQQAVRKIKPYAQQFRGQTFTIKFDANKACANG